MSARLYGLNLDTVVQSDALAYLKSLPDDAVHSIVTSPPYFALRDYNVNGQIGLEPTLKDYIETLVTVFREARRVLRKDGTFWLNIGDSFNGSNQTGGTKSLKTNRRETRMFSGKTNEHTLKPKDLMLVPHRLAIALQDDGWYVRMDNVWAKLNPMPESVTDRPSKSHEYVFLLTKSPTYWYDADAVAEPSLEDTRVRSFRTHGLEDMRKDTGNIYIPKNLKPDGQTPHTMHIKRANGQGEYTSATRNLRSVWHIATEPTNFAHYATMPQALVEICIKAGCPKGGIILDMFMGSGTTAKVAARLDRHYIGCDLNPDYVALATARLRNDDPMQSSEVAPGIVQHSLFE